MRKREIISSIDAPSYYLSRENTHCLKGILAILVLIHHLYQHSGILSGTPVGMCLQLVGYYVVAVFFFLSGYGLMQSNRKNQNSIISFPRNKILPFYIIIITLAFLYLILEIVLKRNIEIGLIIKTLTFGGTIIEKGWYLQVQLLYYIMFYFVFRFVQNKYQMSAMLIAHILYIVVCLLMNLSSIYYERTFIFLMGMIWCQYRDKIDVYLAERKERIITCIINVMIWAICYLAYRMLLMVFFRGVSYIFMMIAVCSILPDLKIQNRISRFLGDISLEIYVVQGFFFSLFRSRIIRIANPYSYIVLVSVFTILGAMALHPLTKFIYRRCRVGQRQ